MVPQVTAYLVPIHMTPSFAGTPHNLPTLPMSIDRCKARYQTRDPSSAIGLIRWMNCRMNDVETSGRCRRKIDQSGIRRVLPGRSGTTMRSFSSKEVVSGRGCRKARFVPSTLQFMINLTTRLALEASSALFHPLVPALSKHLNT